MRIRDSDCFVAKVQLCRQQRSKLKLPSSEEIISRKSNQLQGDSIHFLSTFLSSLHTRESDDVTCQKTHQDGSEPLRAPYCLEVAPRSVDQSIDRSVELVRSIDDVISSRSRDVVFQTADQFLLHMHSRWRHVRKWDDDDRRWWNAEETPRTKDERGKKDQSPLGLASL